MSDRIAVMQAAVAASSHGPRRRRTPSCSWRWAMQRRATGRSTDMMATHRRELSVAAAIGLPAGARAGRPGSFRRRISATSLLGEPAGAGGGDRHDAGHPDRPDRHLGRLGVRDLRRRRRRCSRRPGCRCRPRRWSPACCGAALGAINGALVAYARHPLDRRDAGDDGGAGATGCAGRPQGAWVQDLPATSSGLGLSQASYPLVACGRRGRSAAGIRLGAAAPGGRPRGVRDRLEPGRRAAGRLRHRGS